jgi:uncharacterized protein
MSPRGLIITGSVLVVITSAAYIGYGFAQRDTIEKGRAAEAAAASGAKLTEEQQEAKESYERWRKFNRPTPEELKKDADQWRGNALSVIKARAKSVGHFHSKAYYHPLFWDIWSMMLLGMALFKLGVLSAERSMKFYTWAAVIGYGIGIPLNSYTAWLIIKSNFDPAMHAFSNSTYDLGRLSIAMGHLGMLMILCKAGWMNWLTSRLGAAGQMAFSNYIFQSVVTAFIFTGYGFKLYGTMERHQLYYVVAGIWIFQLIASPIWLKYFRFGPLEWGWRSLTYWKRQPMKLA